MQVVWLWNRHRRCRRLLSAYLDGEVTAPESRTVEEHLSECGACASELEELRAIVAVLRALPDLPVPRSFALEREPVPSDGGAGLLRAARLATAAAGSLAAAMLVGTLAVGVFTGGADDSEAAADSPAVMAGAAAVEAAQPVPAAPAPAAAMKAAPAPVGMTPRAAAAVSAAEADDTRPEEGGRFGASWRLPAALSGLLILFAAATGWLTVLIRRRSP